MFFLGHIGFTLFLAMMFYLPVSIAVTGVLLPDAIDKTLFALKITPCGRFLSHTIFFAPIVGMVVYKLTKRRDLAFALSFGSFLHLIEDAHAFVPFFFPLINYQFNCADFALHLTPFIILMEIVGAALIYTTLFRNKLVVDFREAMWSKIFKSGFPLLPYVQHEGTDARRVSKKKNRNQGKVERVRKSF